MNIAKALLNKTVVKIGEKTHKSGNLEVLIIHLNDGSKVEIKATTQFNSGGNFLRVSGTKGDY